MHERLVAADREQERAGPGDAVQRHVVAEGDDGAGAGRSVHAAGARKRAGHAAARLHDIACDGFYLQALDRRGQALYSGTRLGAYRLAMIVGAS
ncbi:MAG TPA: hypothetical protein VHM31_06935, partial [Polyangia bacterium]|nr:hypothetical protein [Polyangia bacterium]